MVLTGTRLKGMGLTDKQADTMCARKISHRFIPYAPQIAIDRGLGDVQFLGRLTDGALGLEHALCLQRTENIQLVRRVHGIGGNTIAQNGGVDQVAGKLWDGVVQILRISGALLLLGQGEGVEQVGKMLRKHQNVLHIMVHADEAHQMTLFLNEICGGYEAFSPAGTSLVVCHIVAFLIDSGSQQLLGKLRHGVSHAAAAEMPVAGSNDRTLRRGDVVEDDLIVFPADLPHEFHQGNVSLKAGIVAHCIPTFSAIAFYLTKNCHAISLPVSISKLCK